MNKSNVTSHELGTFLRTRRAALHPADIGLFPDPSTRRVPGLRREEVAELAFISTDYYTQLEQGRLTRAPKATLNSIAQALRLNSQETDYLFTLAYEEPLYVSEMSEDRAKIQQPIHNLLNNLSHCPAIIIDRIMHIVEWNPLAVALYLDFGLLSEHERNLLRLTFLHPYFKNLYIDWESSARAGVAFLRMDTARMSTDSKLQNLIMELSAKNTQFQEWWESYDVAYKSFGTKRFQHPLVGDMTLDWQILQYPSNPDYCIMLLTAEPDSLSSRALSALSRTITDGPVKRVI